MVDARLFQVKTTDSVVLITTILALTADATLAALPPAVRAVRIDPAQTLRSE